jgi:hypothetical protein
MTPLPVFTPLLDIFGQLFCCIGSERVRHGPLLVLRQKQRGRKRHNLIGRSIPKHKGPTWLFQRGSFHQRTDRSYPNGLPRPRKIHGTTKLGLFMPAFSHCRRKGPLKIPSRRP